MAYEGYRIKINGYIFPNGNMARGSWNKSTEPRLCESYTDILGINHDVYYPTDKTTIGFTIRPHKEEEHPSIASYFAERANVEVEYYDEDTQTYKTGNFKINKFSWAHDNAGERFIDYAETAVTFEEY